MMMSRKINHITPLSSSSISIRQGAALLLLALLSTTFVLENEMLVEGEVSELIEGTEKEKDIKEKKLLFINQLLDSVIEDYDLIHKGKVEDHFLLSGLFPEVSTPPPERI